MIVSSRTVITVVVSSRTDPDDDVVDVTSFSALDVVEIKLLSSLSCSTFYSLTCTAGCKKHFREFQLSVL